MSACTSILVLSLISSLSAARQTDSTARFDGQELQSFTSLTAARESAAADISYVYQQSLGNGGSFIVLLGDLDNDTDADAVAINSTIASRVWRNNGTGTFASTTQTFPTVVGHGGALGDLDGDGDLDLLIVNNQTTDRIYFNNGSGLFTAGSQTLGAATDYGIQGILSDIDSDGDLDALVANYIHHNKVWLNDGNGVFTLSIETLGDTTSYHMAVGYLNADTFPDVYVENISRPDKIWFNNGSGHFTDSEQALGDSLGDGWSELGDLDGDGDTDLMMANSESGCEVYKNDGAGYFTVYGSCFGDSVQNVKLGDVDRDGDLDAFTVHLTGGSYIWLNDGSGNFTSAGKFFNQPEPMGITLWDTDRDGDLDVFIGSGIWTGGGTIRLYRNETAITSTMLQGVDARYRDGCIEITFTLSEMDEGVAFEALRAAGSAGDFRSFRPAASERDGLAFTMRDTDIEPGTSYRYRVQYDSSGSKKILFETEAITTPPLSLGLRQNRPNPFNPATVIEYDLPAPCVATLAIYNAGGAVIRTLVQENVPAGRHETTWDGLDSQGRLVSSGIYFCRLTAGKNSVSRKMVLVR